MKLTIDGVTVNGEILQPLEDALEDQEIREGAVRELYARKKRGIPVADGEIAEAKRRVSAAGNAVEVAYIRLRSQLRKRRM